VNFVFFYFIIISSIIFLIITFYISAKMNKLSKLLVTQVKDEATIKFLEQSEDFITNSELTNLIEEILIYFENFRSIEINYVSNKIVEKSDKIKDEIGEIFYIILFINKIYTYSKELKRNSVLSRVLSILIVILAIGNGIIIQSGYYFIIPLLLTLISIIIIMGIIFNIFYYWYKLNKSVTNLMHSLK